MLIYYFIGGAVVGGLLAWLVAHLYFRARSVARNAFDQLSGELSAEREKGKITVQLLQSKEAELAKSLEQTNKWFADATALAEKNRSLQEKLENGKVEIENLKRQFHTEFENIANRILDEKTEKFTKVNQESLGQILKPLSENIDTFRKKVEETYNRDSNERFSLGKELEKLVQLNNRISEEANNLTNALKGNSKVQGDWSQMILENILEKSGLQKDREYFTQEYLKDNDGNYLKNEDGSRMQPDVIIAYPDNRKVIVDSKVSLTAYARYVAATDSEEQKKNIAEHLRSIRRHIDDLSRKNYQDFAPTLDFVMLFVPNEPAYLLALQHDSELWHFAYNKRILLISPTNLIAALKLLADLWKREYQTAMPRKLQNAGLHCTTSLSILSPALRMWERDLIKQRRILIRRGVNWSMGRVT